MFPVPPGIMLPPDRSISGSVWFGLVWFGSVPFRSVLPAVLFGGVFFVDCDRYRCRTPGRLFTGRPLSAAEDGCAPPPPGAPLMMKAEWRGAAECRSRSRSWCYRRLRLRWWSFYYFFLLFLFLFSSAVSMMWSLRLVKFRYGLA